MTLFDVIINEDTLQAELTYIDCFPTEDGYPELQYDSNSNKILACIKGTWQEVKQECKIVPITQEQIDKIKSNACWRHIITPCQEFLLPPDIF